MFIFYNPIDKRILRVYNRITRYLTIRFRRCTADSDGKVPLNYKKLRVSDVFFRLCLLQVQPIFLTETEADTMATRVAVMGIIVENRDSTEPLNSLLHEYGEYIIGRMGIPYRERGISIISIAIDAPQNLISALSGKIGNLDGVSVKTAYSHIEHND